VGRARAALPAHPAGPLRGVQPGARQGHDFRPADRGADRERPHEPAPARRLGLHGRLPTGLVRSRAPAAARAQGLARQTLGGCARLSGLRLSGR
jgi:hypothetical protein